MSENHIVRRRLRERGMATVEYALGVLVVIVLIGVVVAALKTGSFGDLVGELIRAILNWVVQAFHLPLPIKF